MYWSRRNLSNGVQKGKEEREGFPFDWRDEIQLGFRVFFWFRVLFCVMCFSLSCFCAFVCGVIACRDALQVFYRSNAVLLMNYL